MFRFLKDIKWLQEQMQKVLSAIGNINSEIKGLKEENKKLKEKIFAPKKKQSHDYMYFLNSSMIKWAMGDSEREITLEEKVDALAKYLKVNFILNSERDAEVVIHVDKPVKKVEKKKKK